MARVECVYEDNNGWRTPDDMWLELEMEKEEKHVYHINIIIEKDDNTGKRTEQPPGEDNSNDDIKSVGKDNVRVGRKSV